MRAGGGCSRYPGLGLQGAVVCALVLLVLIWAVPAPAQESAGLIGAVEVEGNERIEVDTIRSYMAIGPGDPFDASAINRSLKSLFATGLFADVTIRREADALIIRVVENPIINRVAFEGNQRIDDESLEAEVQLRPRVVYTRTRVQSDAQRIIEIYRRSGRFAANVEPKVIQLPQNRVDLVFEIDEGPLTGIRRISFIGNRKFSDGSLRDEIQTRESAWWRFFTSDDTYDPDRLTFDRELLRKFYLGEGYADFRVVSAVAELTSNREDFYITFTVEEGERYRFGSIDVDSRLRDLDGPALMPLVTVFEDDWYDADEVENTIQELTDTVGSLGYAFVDIRPRLKRDRAAHRVDVVFQIDEGPKVYVRRIDIVGNVRTLDKVIRREFRLVEGDAFNAAKIRRSRQAIRNLGFFQSIEVGTTQGEEPDQSILTVEVEEQSTGELSFGAGVSTIDGILGEISIQERNLLGRGQDLRLAFTLSSRRQEIDLSFTEPYFLDRNISAGFDAFRKTLDLQRESSFDQDSIGFNLRTSYRVTDNLRHSLNYALRRDEISDVNVNASRLIREQEGSATTSLVGQTFEYDARDNRIDPSEGFVLRFRQELAGVGGDVRYIRHTSRYGKYWPIREDWVASLLVRQGHILGLGQDVRINDRFFLGGNSLRGFRPAGVGPRDVTTNDSLGGNLFYSGTIELSIPLNLTDAFDIRGKLFSDAGSLATIDDDGSEIADVGSLRASVGVGLAYKSPLGPIRIDFTKAVLQESFDETEIFRFSFGTRF